MKKSGCIFFVIGNPYGETCSNQYYYYVDYDKALSDLNLESLEKRREGMALKFVKNSLKNANFAKLFLREVKHGMKFRMSEKYFVNPSKTKDTSAVQCPFCRGY